MNEVKQLAPESAANLAACDSAAPEKLLGGYAIRVMGGTRHGYLHTDDDLIAVFNTPSAAKSQLTIWQRRIHKGTL